MRRTFAGLLCVVATVVPNIAGAASVTYLASFRPINYSGVTGQAELVLDGQLLTIKATATGLTKNGPHNFYLRGLFDGSGNVANSVRPGQVGSDRDGDGYVEIDESLDALGQPLLDLGQRFTPNGTLQFEQTFDLGDSALLWPGVETGDFFPLTERALVLHGRSLVGKWGRDTIGEINGENGYKPLLPVATAVIRLPTDPDDPDPDTGEPGPGPGPTPGPGSTIPTPAAAAMGLVLLGASLVRRG